MIQKFISFVICLSSIFAVNGKVVENNIVKSKILSKDISYSVYFPENYDTDTRSYPVIYLLPGYGDNHTSWVQNGNISMYADVAIRESKIPPVIIVIPDGGVSMYINSFDGKSNYEDFFVKEFMPTIEGIYRTKKGKSSRGILGHSMGGWGAMLYALKYPDLFVAAAPLSAGIHDDYDIQHYDNERWETVFGSIFGSNLRGTDRLTECWYKNSILKIVDTKSKTEIEKVHFRISCGDQDILLKGSILLHLALAEKNINHQLRIKEGAHTWNYWRSDITEALEFITDYFM